MKNEIYIVTAYRWGDISNHSYIVGVYSNEEKAQSAKKFEEEWRGGKYICDIILMDVDGELPEYDYKVISKLPK